MHGDGSGQYAFYDQGRPGQFNGLQRIAEATARRDEEADLSDCGRGSAHVSKVTQVIMESLKGKLRLFYLPPYSPDLNPDDLAWNHLKNHTAGRMAMTDEREI